MTASEAPQNTDSIHRIVAAPGKTDRILATDAPVHPFLRINKFTLVPREPGQAKVEVLNGLLSQAFAV